MTPTKLTINTSARGLEQVVVYTDDDGRADAALASLRRVLPALRDLDRRARDRR